MCDMCKSWNGYFQSWEMQQNVQLERSQVNFERAWGYLEAKNCLQRQSFHKYLRQTLVFM